MYVWQRWQVAWATFCHKRWLETVLVLGFSVTCVYFVFALTNVPING